MVQAPRLTTVNTRLGPPGRSDEGSDPHPGLPTVLKSKYLQDSSLTVGVGPTRQPGFHPYARAMAPPRHYATQGGRGPRGRSHAGGDAKTRGARGGRKSAGDGEVRPHEDEDERT